MSNVQTQIDRIISAVDAAHAKVAEKGGTTARPYLVGTLADAIDTIPTGVELPTLTNEGAAADLLTGKQLIDGDGNVVNGSMPNNGAVNKTMDGIEVKSVSVPAGYTSGGTVALDGTIDDIADDQAGLIAQIQTALEGKAAGGGSGGSVETIEVTLNRCDLHRCYYQTPSDLANGTFTVLGPLTGSHEISCLKNSIIIITDGYGTSASNLSAMSTDVGTATLLNVGNIANKGAAIVASQSGTISMW